jgi:hypothetical protein
MRIFLAVRGSSMISRSLLIPPLALLVAALPVLAQAQSRYPSAAPAPIPAPPAPARAAAPAPPPTAATPATTAALPVIPAHTCVAPTFPPKDAANAKIVAFNADYKIYGDCIKKYVDDNRTWINAVVESNNKAIDEYNKYNENLKQQIEAAKKD